MDWKADAKEQLHEHLSKLTKEPVTSDEYQDLYTDLKAHIEEEIHRAGKEQIERNDLYNVLQAMGDDEFEAEQVLAVNQALIVNNSSEFNEYRKESSASSNPGYLSRNAWIFTILLPALALLVELLSHIGRSVYFDPIPTWFHVVLIALVPIAFYLVSHINDCSELYEDGDARRLKRPKITASLLGFIFPTIVYYAVLSLPVILVGVIGCIILVGLLILTPFFVFIGWFPAVLKLRNTLEVTRNTQAKKWLYYGMLTGLIGLVSIEMPDYLRQSALNKAVNGDVLAKQEGIDFLRNYANDEALLSMCYNERRGGRGIGGPIHRRASHLVYNYFNPFNINSKQARELYYRVTGNPFNSVKSEYSGRYRIGESRSWDPDHGGDAVAGRMKGLNI